MSTSEYIDIAKRYSAPNYSPLDVVLSKGEGAWVWDVEGRKFLDMLSAYSAVNFGHRNPRITERAIRQLEEITLTSRAFYSKELSFLSKELAEIAGVEKVLIMNTGAEAVETAVKGARRWGYEVKGVPDGEAEILCFSGNFHGRTTTIISFSDSPESRLHFGPYTPGFRILPYGDPRAVEEAITEKTVGVLVEPIQGEGGINIPPPEFLRTIRRVCTERNVLMIADEIQTGLCRTGALFACEHEGVVPDIYIIGKSLGGGIVPISAMLGKAEVLDLFRPGSHGSTFGGNPFASAIAREVLAIIREERPEVRVREVGERLMRRVREFDSPKIKEVRGRGLLIGIEIHKEHGKAKKYCEALKDRGLLCKDTREQTMRLAPPLVMTDEDLDWAVEQLRAVFL